MSINPFNSLNVIILKTLSDFSVDLKIQSENSRYASLVCIIFQDLLCCISNLYPY